MINKNVIYSYICGRCCYMSDCDAYGCCENPRYVNFIGLVLDVFFNPENCTRGLTMRRNDEERAQNDLGNIGNLLKTKKSLGSMPPVYKG